MPDAAITLEPIARVHAAALQPLLEDAAIAAMTPFPHPYPSGGAEVYIDESVALRDVGLKYVFAICDDRDGPVGMVMLKDVDHEHGEAELGYWVGKPFWGRGLASTAAAAMVAYGFESLDLLVIHAICFADNPASLRVLANVGFEQTETFQETLAKWPDPRTSTRWRLTRETWQSHHV